VKTATRLLTGLVLLAFALLSVRAMPSGWLTPFGLQWQAARPQAGAGSLVVCRRIQAREAIARRVLANDLGLLEAAAWFAYLNDTPAEQPDPHWRRIPGNSDGEKLCRQVILCARYQAWTKTAPSDEQVRRLSLVEEELKQHLACHGTITLSDLIRPAE
jgi:hypothetical protein